MEPFRLHLKIGQHEFEAQGEQEAVERQAAVWRELISALPSQTQSEAAPPQKGAVGPEVAGDFTEYDKVFHQDKRTVSLTALPAGERAEADAALLVLLGRKHYLDEDLVGGSWVIGGLQRSGLQPGPRVERVFGDYMPRYVLASGLNRAKRYRLTNPGLVKAKEIARELAQTVA